MYKTIKKYNWPGTGFAAAKNPAKRDSKKNITALTWAATDQ